MGFSDNFFKKVEKKTKVNKETILELANKLQNGNMKDESTLKGDSETKRLRFFNPDEVPENLMDADLIKTYLNYTKKRHL